VQACRGSGGVQACLNKESVAFSPSNNRRVSVVVQAQAAQDGE
jgi:hypothetical protein